MAPDSVSLLRQDVSNHARTIGVLVDEHRAFKDELALLHLDKARRDERAISLVERLERIERSIDGVYRLGWWLLAAFGASAIALIANFAFKGGFIVP